MKWGALEMTRWGWIIAIGLLCGVVSNGVAQETNDARAPSGEAEPRQEELRNENRIIRPKPGKAASRIGTAIAWVPSWDEACQLSKESGKPIFWYVPTVPGTFMDRKVEIDRYMLAGPFSNPKVIEHLNRSFIPTRGAPNAQLAEQFKLLPYQFVEPGFLVLDSGLEVKQRVDHLTTLHADWFARLVGVPQEAFVLPQEPHPLDLAWEAFRDGAQSADIPELDPQHERVAESLLLKGMFAFRRGEHATARAAWQKASELQPDSPAAWKAAAEAEGLGPFVRGFEPWNRLPERAWLAGSASVGSAAPSETYGEAELWQRGVEFLLEMQREDGGVVDSDYDFGGYDSLPNVHVAITSLCGLALLDAKSRLPAEWQPQLDDAIGQAAAYVCHEDNLNPNDQDEILWAYAYRTRFLARLCMTLPENQSAAWRIQLQTATEKLESIQLKTGGWAHEYANPFVTATALAALYVAQQAGAKVDSEKLAAGLAALQSDRFPNGAYPYNSQRRRRPAERNGELPDTAPSAGRMAIGELALWYWRKIDQAQLQTAAQISLAGQQYLDVAYKYDNHTSTMAYGGFFFWYDLRARAELISQIEDPEVRHRLAASQRKIMLQLPEVDGRFVDSHELGRCYGTAMALLSFALLDKAQQ
jgi:hypothetical protein